MTAPLWKLALAERERLSRVLPTETALDFALARRRRMSRIDSDIANERSRTTQERINARRHSR